jgi:hypothetical protein
VVSAKKMPVLVTGFREKDACVQVLDADNTEDS